jgi:outer membrane lipoprotein-sorting protein
MRMPCLLMLVGSLVAWAQPALDATQILKQVAATYASATDYELVAVTTEPGQKIRSQVAFRAPNQVKWEVTRVDLDPPMVAYRAVLSASGMWTYVAEMGSYWFTARNELLEDLSREMRTDNAFKFFRSADKYAPEAKFLREETIEIEGTKIACYALSVSVPELGPLTWWVSKETSYVRRMASEPDSFAEYVVVRLNARLPDELFQFSPPPGAKRLDLP